MLPLYHGDPLEAANLAGEASALALNGSCVAASLAPILEGLAWAKAGNIDLARQALTTARDAYDGLAPACYGEGVFGFSPRRRFFYEGRLLTLLADYEAAEKAHDQALELYPANVVGDPALIELDRAAALVATNETDAGAALVVETLHRLPAAHRTRLFLTAARDVVSTISQQHRELPAVRQGWDALAELTEHTPVHILNP